MKHSIAYEYLIKQILRRNCTVVLGAGASNSARFKNTDDTPHYVSNMCESLLRNICEEACVSNCIKLKKDKSIKAEKNCEISSEFMLNRLSRLCERYVWKNGIKNSKDYRKLITELKIDEFNKLQPAKVHYFIAFIAREGYLSEVITTNYDCCVEIAYIRSWGMNEAGLHKDNCPTARIFNRSSFDKNAARKLWSDDEYNSGKPYVLRVYKINGCASEIQKTQDNYSSILLTDTQLQNWRERQWAADLFRNRLRSTSLFFCGFGSDEPQILHTIEKVFEEYNPQRSAYTKIGKNILELPNAPIVASYDNQPSFAQRYIVESYMNSCGRKSLRNPLIVSRSSFRPEDISLPNKVNLLADELWEKIFKDIYIHLVKKSLDYSIRNENSAFTSMIPYCKIMLKMIRDSWEKDYIKSHKNKSLLEKLYEIEYHSINCGTPIPLPNLTRILSMLIQDSNDAYCTISDNMNLTSEIVFIFWMIRCYNMKMTKLSKGVLVNTECENGNINFILSLNKDDIETHVLSGIENMPSTKLIIGNGSHLRKCKSYRAIQIDSNKSDTMCSCSKVKYYKIAQLSWNEIFCDFEIQGNRDYSIEIEKRINDAITFPSRFLAVNRDSISRRLYSYKMEDVE